jgi:putative transposase
VIIRPSTLLKFHGLLINRKYRLIFSSGRKGKPGTGGPSPELIQTIIDIKQRNPCFDCLGIAQQIDKAFGMDINKDLVRRVLAKHYRAMSEDNQPSWLTFIGYAKDSLWSIELFCSALTRCLWQWIISRGASLALVCMQGVSIVPPSEIVGVCFKVSHHA